MCLSSTSNRFKKTTSSTNSNGSTVPALTAISVKLWEREPHSKKQQAWVEKCKADKNRKVQIVCCGEIHIGFMGLFNINRNSGKAQAFIATDEKTFWSKGWGQKAFTHLIAFGFDKLILQKIALGVFETNKPAIKLYEKLNFETEGNLKPEALIEGKLQTLLLMAKFRKL